MNKRFLFLFFVFCFCVYGYESGVSFLKISPAYPVEASSLFKKGVFSFWHNPAFLKDKKELGIAYNFWIEDVRIGYFGFSIPFNGGVFGISGTFLDSGEIPHTTLTQKTAAESYTAPSHRISLGIVTGRTDLKLGISLSSIEEKIYKESAQGGAVSVGGLLKKRNFEFSLFLRNLGLMTEMREKSSPLPLTFGAGILKNVKKGRIGISLSKARDENMKFSGGMNFSLYREKALSLDLDAGYSTGFEDAGSSSGVWMGSEISIRNFSISISYFYFGDLGNPLRISAQFRF